MRFLLGMAESGVFPATLVLLANWFPEAERARANSYWQLCQPLGLVGSAPLTAWLLGRCGWQQVLLLEGALPFLWLPIWWFGVRDHPREAAWISPEERSYLETTLAKEAAKLEPVRAISTFERCLEPPVFLMVIIYFLHNCAAYGCMTFFTSGLKGRGFSPVEYGILFAIPYALTAVLMVLNSWHSDKTHERRGHAAVVYLLCGISLMLSVLLSGRFWVSYTLLCLAIPGPFVAMGPFWAIPSETLPRNVAGLVIGVVNACGNLGGFAGPFIVGWLAKIYHNTGVSFCALGVGMIVCAALAMLLPKEARLAAPAPMVVKTV
jgi:MFS family permease